MFRLLLFALILVSVFQSNAQICTGSLGDPIVNITFGAGANPGPALSTSTVVGYQYVSNDCPQDGQYSIRNTSVSCHNSTWHTITDHTGNTNGYFMLVNASVQPNPFYVDTVRGLCGNTTYEFSAWVINMLKPSSCGGGGIQPDLTFRIEKTDGSILQSYSSNKIPPAATPQWTQCGFFFTTTSATSDVVIRIINNSSGGCGNDLALDDITFRPCGPLLTTSIVGTTGNAVNHCEGTSKAYTFSSTISSGFTNPVVQWQESLNSGSWTDISGATSVTYTKTFTGSTAAGTYNFRLTAAESGNLGTSQCRINSPVLQVIVNPNLLPSVSSNSPICVGQTISISASGSNISWIGPNGFSGSGSKVDITNAQLLHAGKYYLQSANGSCTRIDSINITINPSPTVGVDISSANLCEGDSVLVNLTGANSYTWQPSQGVIASASSAWLKPTDSILYVVTGTSAGCSDTASVQVNITTKPKANAGTDRTIMEGSSVQLQGIVTGDSLKYFWSPDYRINSLQMLQPFVSPLKDTAYTFTAQSLIGCGIDKDTVRVRVLKKLIVPNAFSPNGDGINDVWMIDGIEAYNTAEAKVFDRFGKVVFQTTRFKSWNGTITGKKLPMGTYYYIIDTKAGLPVLTGWLQLLY